MTTEELVECRQDRPGIAVLTLNRPDKRNALNIPMLEHLCSELDRVNAMQQVRAIVIRGAGSVFCAGLDLKEATDTEKSHESARLVARMLNTIYDSHKVTIAAVHGAAMAGGAGLMTACDLAIATSDCNIGYPEVRRGLVAGLVMTFLRRQLHERHARELLLCGEIVTAERAEQIGLVNRCVPTDMLQETVDKYCDLVLQSAPGAIEKTKRFYDSLWSRSVKDDIQDALSLHVEVRNADEAQEGMKAFFDKRDPKWMQ